jgi:predicted phosphodiesterase
MRKRGADSYWCLGDTFGYFPDGSNCFERIQDFADIHLMGNHEAMLINKIEYDSKLDSVYRLGEQRPLLSQNMLNELRELPLSATETSTGIRLQGFHGAPWDELQGYIYPNTDVPAAYRQPGQAFVVGNTHRPFILSWPTGGLVNVGSIGLPRDIGNQASFAVVDIIGDSVTLEVVRVPLPIDIIIDKYEAQIHTSVVQLLRKRGT